MKKLFILITALSLLAFGMVSCDRNDDLTDEGWVDLGLPSGLLWAKCNIGATTPEEYGNYYAWGETQTKEIYDWDTYIYGDYDSTYHLYKYNSSEDYGTVDNKTVLDASDDVATVVLGTGARIPTYNEWVELWTYTTRKWAEQNGVKGWKLTATNGKSIFLPAAGHRADSSLYYTGSYGFYWFSSLNTDYPYLAFCICYNSDNSVFDSDWHGEWRSTGQSVRAVRASQN